MAQAHFETYTEPNDHKPVIVNAEHARGSFRRMPTFEPKCTLVPESSQYTKTWIRDIQYRPNEALVMRIVTAEVGDIELCFERIDGFRVLDELQLCEFWTDYHAKNGWLWEVTAGGWIELESMRERFLAAQFAELSKRNLVEYFVTSMTSCVSVMASKPPVFRRLKE